MDVFLRTLLDRLESSLDGWGVLLIPFLAALFFWGLYHYRIFFGENGSAEGDKERREADLNARRRWIAKRTFARRYRHLLGRGLDRIAERWARDAERLHANPDGWAGRLFGVNPFTEGSWLLCLRLALVYPLLGFIVAWVAGGSGSLAGLALLPELEWAIGRWLVLVGMGVVGWMFWKGLRIEGWRSQIYFFGAVAVAVAVAVTVAVAAPVAVHAAFVVAIVAALVGTLVGVGFITGPIAVAFVGVFSGTFAIAIVIAGAIAIAIAIAGEALRGRINKTLALGAFWMGLVVLLAVCVLVAILWTLPRAEHLELLLIPVFLGLLPIANALFDWVSLGFTRGLLYAIYRCHHTGLLALGWAVLDILLALLFLLGIATLTTALLALLNAFGDAYVGKTLIDLGELLGGLKEAPAALDYAWIHFMMLSTLAPTLVHFTLAGAALVLTVPESWRGYVLKGWEGRGDARFVAFLLVTVTPFLALIGPIALLYLLWLLVTGWHGAVGWWLLDWVIGVARFIDPTFVLPNP